MNQDTFRGHDAAVSDGTDQASGDGRRGHTRRRLLSAAGTVGMAGVAGCLGLGGGESEETDEPDQETPTASGEEWRTYQRDNRNSGFNPNGIAPATEPEIAWTGTVQHTDGPATVADGVVYVGGRRKVFAYDAESGEEQWTYEIGDMVDAAVTVADGTLVFPSRAGKVHALDAADGSEKWTQSKVNGKTIVEGGDLKIKQASATVANGTVYVTKEQLHERQTFFGLDLETGDVELAVDPSPENDAHEWAADRGQDSFNTTPAVVDGTAYVGSNAGFAYAVDLEKGTVQWATRPEAKRDEPISTVFGSPAVVDGMVYFANHAQGSDNNPVLYGLDAASGAVQWSYRLGPAEHGSRSVGSMCVAHGAVIASNRNGVLHAVERDDGTERWTYDTGRKIYGAASAGAERVYVGNDGGRVFALDPSSGELKWTFGGDTTKIARVDAAPTPVDGTLYATSDRGPLVALREP